MARLFISALTVPTSCAAGADQTLVQVRAGVVPIIPIEWGVSFDGTNSSATPAQVKLQLQTTGGTMTQAGAGQKYNSAATASLASYRVNATAEPTDGAILGNKFLTPIGGLLEKQWPLGREIELAPGERLSVVVTAGTGSAATAVGHIVFEE